MKSRREPQSERVLLRQYGAMIADGAALRKGWRRERVRERPTCDYCGVGVTQATATVDHATPTAMGGPDRPDNWRLSCQWCNARKGDTTEAQYRDRLRCEGVGAERVDAAGVGR
jgi:5-methylcytosine-specific restriction endonuclease McrA